MLCKCKLLLLLQCFLLPTQLNINDPVLLMPTATTAQNSHFLKKTQDQVAGHSLLALL